MRDPTCTDLHKDEEGKCTLHPPSYATEEMVVHESHNQEILEDEMKIDIEEMVSKRLAMQCKNSRGFVRNHMGMLGH
jgi:hypothetical protein